ncbi:hypothetical protein HGI81_02210 [Olsenella sp. KGMB02461]|nr:hypothetical protein [Olsenella sp. KGMB02461]
MTVLGTSTGQARCRLRIAAAFVATVCVVALLALPYEAKAASGDVAVAVPIEVSCPSSVKDPPQFTFEMTPLEGAPEVSPLDVSCGEGKGSGAFSAHFNASGTYRYKLRQTGVAPSRWTFDNAQWDVLIQVLRADDGSIASNVVITPDGGGAKYPAAAFSNGYAESAKPASEDPSPKKQAQGGLPRLGDREALWILALIVAGGAGAVSWRIAARS